MSSKEKLAYTAVILFGLISLFGDIVYEGARSSIPTYLELLAAPAFIVGFAVGLGDFLGYALRLVFGYVADTKKSYWALTITGYALIGAIPILAFTTNWEIAVILVVVERLGKAIRSPARDTLLSVATRGWGRGKAFGFHELMDQTGATLGPLIVAFAIYTKMQEGALKLDQLRYAFSILAIPYLILIAVLIAGYLRLSSPIENELKVARALEKDQVLSRKFYFYSFAILLNTAGLFPISLILYLSTSYFSRSLWVIPIIYLIVQLIDAIFAPISGHMYDKYGIKVLAMAFIVSIFPTLFISMIYINIFSIEPWLILLIGAGIFGVVLGMQESVYRAAVADLTSISKRGIGYGIFNVLYGLGFWISGSIMGLFLDMAGSLSIVMLYAVIYTIILQAIALVLLRQSYI